MSNQIKRARYKTSITRQMCANEKRRQGVKPESVQFKLKISSGREEATRIGCYIRELKGGGGRELEEK
jgi:hypothetical protein